MDLSIRPMAAAEAPLVFDSWTRSTVSTRQLADSRSGSRYVCRIGLDGTNVRTVGWAFFSMHRAWVKQLLAEPETAVLVATLPGHDEAMGWAAVTLPGTHPLVLHYVFTVTPARRRGVATALVRAALDLRDGRAPRFSHTSSIGEALLGKISLRTAAPMRSEAAMT